MRAKPWHVAFLCSTLALGWQWLVVAGYFDTRWSALFVTGDRFEQPAPVQAEGTYVLPDSYGYDGQFYHAMAHDPLDLHATDRFLDAPRVRYSRILIPTASYLLGLGQLYWVDRAYRALELLSVWLGVWSAGALARGWNRSAWWGAAFLALPATFISLERQLLDLPLCALIVAAVFCWVRGWRTWCWVALAAAALDREMGLVAIAAFALTCGWRTAAAAVPAIAWIGYVQTIPAGRGFSPSLSHPLASVFHALGHLQGYSSSRVFLQTLDVVAVVGAVLAFGFGIRMWFHKRDPITALALGAALFGIIASGSPAIEYQDVYSFGRQNSPLFLAQLLWAMRERRPALILPLILVLPRAVIPGASMTLRALAHLLS